MTQQRFSTKCMSGIKVFRENAHDMLKQRWQILSKKTEIQTFNVGSHGMHYATYSL